MAKTSDMKARIYSKHSRGIYVCAKAGGADPEGNVALRSLIERAKKDLELLKQKVRLIDKEL